MKKVALVSRWRKVGAGSVRLAAVLSILGGNSAFSHQEQRRDEGGAQSAALEKSSSGLEQERIARIGSEYSRVIAPIFQTKCFACHGDSGEEAAAKYPWYYSIPGIKQLIDNDVMEAKKHIDMRPGFPFGGHGTPTEDLQAIEKSVNNATMPPVRYWIMHWNSRLSVGDRAAILNWTRKSQELLNSQIKQ